MKTQPWDGMNPKDGPQIIADLRVHAVPIDSIRPQKKNPRIGDVEVLRGSLRLFGQRQVATYRPGGEINVHSHLWMAAKAEGMTHFAAIELRDDDDATALAWGLAENRSHDVGTYDDQQLERDLEELARIAPDLLTGSGYDVDAVIADLHLDELDMDDPLPVTSGGGSGGGFVPGRRKVKPHELDPLDRTPGGDNDPAPAVPPPASADSDQDTTPVTTPVTTPDNSGPDIAATPTSTGPAAHPEVDMPEDSPTVLLAVGDLRALVERPAWTAWRDDMMEACEGDRTEAGRNAAVLLGFPPDAVTAYQDTLPPLDRRR